ncbi:MAG: response regulator [Candidatus Marinimicrobia bacterium]|nr:response regulator [Candidatus Neomarinimicrobiota bacterium]
MDSRTKKVYLGKARHNLKNPVNAILGYSEMLIEDCEDEGLHSVVEDLGKLYFAGKDILTAIETNFSDQSLSLAKKKISDIGKQTELDIRTPLNTIIGYSELIIEDNPNIRIETFHSDIQKIIDSGRNLEKELSSIITFDVSSLNISKDNHSTNKNVSLLEDVLKSIQPLDKDDKKSKISGRILAVDDNINNTSLLKKRMEKKGHQVITANDGKEALIELLNSDNDIDVVLLDIIMPKMNGFEVLKYIRNDKRLFDLPVIMISSMDDTDSIFRCIEFGADDYVKKPFDNSILEARINTSIEKRQLREKEKTLLIELQEERKKSDNLLLNILPRKIADRLKTGEVTIADKHENVTILFADLVSFTPQAKDLSAQKLVGILNSIFKRFDVSADLYDIEKIKTIGDSYFAVGGLKTNPKDGARKVIQFSKEMILIIKEINNFVEEMNLEIRVGVHTGDVVAGVIGKNKFAYDLWGSTVNMANRLETTSENGKIHISTETKEILGNSFTYTTREKINIKGIGETRTYFIND